MFSASMCDSRGTQQILAVARFQGHGGVGVTCFRPRGGLDPPHTSQQSENARRCLRSLQIGVRARTRRFEGLFQRTPVKRECGPRRSGCDCRYGNPTSRSACLRRRRRKDAWTPTPCGATRRKPLGSQSSVCFRRGCPQSRTSRCSRLRTKYAGSHGVASIRSRRSNAPERRFCRWGEFRSARR
jgi:hypothetical protein